MIDPHVIEAILNHASGHKANVAGTYNRALYREPKRIGLQVRADWLEATIEGRAVDSNVVALGAYGHGGETTDQGRARRIATDLEVRDSNPLGRATKSIT